MRANRARTVSARCARYVTVKLYRSLNLGLDDMGKAIGSRNC